MRPVACSYSPREAPHLRQRQCLWRVRLVAWRAVRLDDSFCGGFCREHPWCLRGLASGQTALVLTCDRVPRQDGNRAHREKRPARLRLVFLTAGRKRARRLRAPQRRRSLLKRARSVLTTTLRMRNVSGVGRNSRATGTEGIPAHKHTPCLAGRSSSEFVIAATPIFPN